MSPSARAWLGVGVGLRWPHLEALREGQAGGAPGPEVLELTPSHWFGQPELLDEIAPNHAIVLHDVLASLATVGPLDRGHLRRVATLARRVGAVDYSEHLAMTRSPRGLDLGHLIPAPRTRAQLSVLVDHLREAQDLLDLPVAVELPATTLELPGAELDEGDFVRALVARSGCGLHLDIENLRVDALNEAAGLLASAAGPGGDASGLIEALVAAAVPEPLARSIGRRLARLPLDAVTRIHLAGGHASADRWVVDSHAAPVPALDYAILGAVWPRLRPRAIIIERDAALPPLAALLDEVARVKLALA